MSIQDYSSYKGYTMDVFRPSILYYSLPSYLGFDEYKMYNLLKKYKIECNIYSIRSIVKKDNKHVLEIGARLDIFSIQWKTIKAFHREMQKALNVNCAYLKRGKYNGCIAEYKGN